jgi:hypothetical protein
MKKYIFLISIFLYINIPIFSQTQTPGTSKTTTQKVVDTGKKVINKVMELFALPHKTPKNYIPISTIELTDKNNFKNIEIQKNTTPELELKVLYPRITPEKGFVSFQLGDFNYYRYIKNIEKSNSMIISTRSDSKLHFIFSIFYIRFMTTKFNSSNTQTMRNEIIKLINQSP